jgi:hypothetical protein
MMKFFRLLMCMVCAVSALGSAPSAKADENEGGQSVSHVAKEETLPTTPKWSTSITSAYFDLSGSRAANNNLYSFGDYTVFTEDLKLQFTIAPGWNLMVLGQYVNNSVVVNVGSVSIPFQTSGLGDTWIEGVHPLVAQGPFLVVADAGVSLPTGSISEQNPLAPAIHDAPFIQLGSGTFDGVFGLTSLYRNSLVTLGNRLSSTLRTGNNDEGYHLGNVYKVDGWMDVPLKYGFTPRLTGFYRLKGGMTGWDPTLPRQPLTEYYYHNQADWDVAAALRYAHSLWNNLSIIAEADLPFYQGMSNYDNVGIKTNLYGTVSLNGQF